MELYQLNTFVKIADEGSLTRAAELLFTSQPAISAQLKALEEELGIALFERSSRGMQLTARGRLLYEQAAETLAAAAKFKNDAQQLQQELVGELHIGVHTDFDFMRIGELHRRLQHDHPRISPHFEQGMTSQILPDLRRGKLDAGFYFGDCRQADLASVEIAAIPMQVVAPADWRDRVEGASLESLAGLPWVYTSDTCPFFTLTQSLFSGLREEPNKVAYVDSEDAVRALIRAGAGLSMLRSDDAQRMQDNDEGFVWQGETPTIALGFAVQRQRAAEPVIDALLTIVRDMWIDDRDLANSVEA